MAPVVLDNIPFELGIPALLERLRVDEDSPDAAEVAALAREAEAVARPKALYRIAYVEERGADHVIVDGTRLSSRILAVNLQHAHRIFAYSATCGTELDEWGSTKSDLLSRYWATAIQETALGTARQALNRHLDERYRPGRTSTMSPGRLDDWPMTAQRSLFTLLGDSEAMIGVRLTDSMLMVPTKSISGIRFPTEDSFESCELCPRESCPGRRAVYDAGLWDRKYRYEES